MSTTRREDSKPHKTFGIIVVGDSGVGKTSLMYRFCESKFITTLSVTIGVDYRAKTLHIDGEDIQLQLWDTAGSERFRHSMVPQYYRKAQAVVLVYDVTNRASFDSLVYWLDECDRKCSTNVAKILVGNKCDEKQKLVVNKSIAQIFAYQHNIPVNIQMISR
ncbi:hypothetical protein RI129_007772 [Pyrocoelia pectoralis]|uniref:Uncharacterized protein n=1 Tax=Pyrocoelia pectoralis TaxID=417401 RepID=A0AAN7ZIT0_9COLE